MKSRVKMLVAAVVVVGGVVWGAGAQMPIEVTPSDINLRAGTAQIHMYQVPATSISTVNLSSAGRAQMNLYSNAVYSNATLSAQVVSLAGGQSVILQAGDATYNLGNFHANGTISTTGIKPFIHPHLTDETKAIRYVAIESDEVLTLARGVAKTENGQAIINLPEYFAMVTSKDAPITVLLTAKGAPALLYTTEESREKIVVAMKGTDFMEFKDVEFSYQVTGVRDGFEKVETIINVNEIGNKVSARENVQKRIEMLNEKIMEKYEIKGEEQ
jgi:hypothetical protein